MDSVHIHARPHEATGATILVVHGFLDTATSVELEKELQRVLRARCWRVVIDLTGVDYISSAGWGIFLSEIRHIRQHDGDLRLVGMKPEVYEVYELLEFRSVIKHFATVEGALAAFAPVEPAVAPSVTG